MYYWSSQNRFEAGRPSAVCCQKISFGIINLHTSRADFTLHDLHAGLSETAFGTASRRELWADQVLVEEEMGGVSLRLACYGWGVV
jgi:hypothetical protein